MYLFGDTDPLYRRNFEFFIEHMDADGGGSVDFVIFVQVVRGASISATHQPHVSMTGRASVVVCEVSLHPLSSWRQLPMIGRRSSQVSMPGAVLQDPGAEPPSLPPLPQQARTILHKCARVQSRSQHCANLFSDVVVRCCTSTGDGLRRETRQSYNVEDTIYDCSNTSGGCSYVLRRATTLRVHVPAAIRASTGARSAARCGPARSTPRGTATSS